MDLTKVSLIGYLISDPEQQIDDDRKNTVVITLADERDAKRIKSETVLRTEEPQRIIAYGKLAEIMLAYLKTGDRVYVEGRLTDVCPDATREAHPSVPIIATQLLLLGQRAKARKVA